MIGVVTRDSAQRRPSDKHRSDARHCLRHRRPLVPRQADRLAAEPCPILCLPPPDPRPGRRRGHSAGCERGHCDERDGARDRPPEPPGGPQAARRPRRGPAHPRRRPPRCRRPGRAPVPPGHPWPDVPIRPWTTSSTPMAPCHPSGPQRSAGPAQRVDTVTAVAFPALPAPPACCAWPAASPSPILEPLSGDPPHPTTAMRS